MAFWKYMIFAPNPYRFKIIELSRGNGAVMTNAELKGEGIDLASGLFRCTPQTFAQAVLAAGYTGADFDVYQFDLDSVADPNVGARIFGKTSYDATVVQKNAGNMIRKDGTYHTIAQWRSNIEAAITALNITTEYEGTP